MSILQLTDEQRKDLYLTLAYGLAYKSYLIAHTSDLTINYEPYIYNQYNLQMHLILIPKYTVESHIDAFDTNKHLLVFSDLHTRFMYHANKIQSIINMPDFRDIIDYLKTIPKTEIPNDLSELKILKAKYDEWKIDMVMKYGFDLKQFPMYRNQIKWHYSLQLHDLRSDKDITINTILLAIID